jgi:hypothetical protein
VKEASQQAHYHSPHATHENGIRAVIGSRFCSE